MCDACARIFFLRSPRADPKREICRLKTNWFFITVIASLYAISYTSVSSSFHQFITNPREQDINRSQAGMDEVGANQPPVCNMHTACAGIIGRGSLHTYTPTVHTCAVGAWAG